MTLSEAHTSFQTLIDSLAPKNARLANQLEELHIHINNFPSETEQRELDVTAILQAFSCAEANTILTTAAAGPM
jgi:hypothetical protein